MIIGLLIVLLIITCPNEEDYYSWLSKNHNLSCEDFEYNQICHYNDEEIEWHSKHVRSAGIFMQVKATYTNPNAAIEIRTIGILNYFFDYSDL